MSLFDILNVFGTMTHNRLPKLLTRHIAEIIGESKLESHFKHFPPNLMNSATIYDINNNLEKLHENLGVETKSLNTTSNILDKNSYVSQYYKENNIKPLSLYWGTATTSSPHFGYFLPLLKLRDFLTLNLNVTILLADIHAALDKMEFHQIEHSRRYYEFVLKEILKSINVDPEEYANKEIGYLKFKIGSDFQLSPQYIMDLYKLSHISTIDGARSASAMVVKQTDNPVLSSIMYPLMQSLDEEYLGADIQFGGVDQRKIFMFSRETLPRIGYEKRSYLMNPLIPALSKDGKMSSSEPSSKIDLTDSNDTIEKKVKKAYSIDGEVENNGLLAILNHIIFPYLEGHENKLLIERPQKYGGNITFNSYVALEGAFKNQEIVSSDLKENVAREIIRIIDPVRSAIEKNYDLYQKAYNKDSEKKKEKSNTKGGIFTLYIDERVSKIQKQNPTLTEGEIMKQYGQKIREDFKNLNDNEKRELQEKLSQF